MSQTIKVEIDSHLHNLGKGDINIARHHLNLVQGQKTANCIITLR